jgi:hypothetical protein
MVCACLISAGPTADVTVYPVQGFTAYVIISIIWLFLGGFMVGIYPLWEARKGIWGVSLQIVDTNSMMANWSDLYCCSGRHSKPDETGIENNVDSV